ncbi:MAG: FtsX-like permease family protein [Hyphomicrobiaceae bacterium]|nr:FtsX-like permease family protein [Hyphomicrobiaceae bacterium]
MTAIAAHLEEKAQRLRKLPLILSLALREQRNGLKGFYVFIACVALGVAVITGVGALGDALRGSFERQGEALLGGDVALSRPHQALEGKDRDWVYGQGRVSETATLRAMARRPDGSEQALVELKGVDTAYPLAGQVTLQSGRPLDEAIHKRRGAVLEPVLLERLNLKVGDTVRLGKSDVAIVDVIAAEPDKITERFTVGPRVLVSLETLRATGLADPGSLISWRYALKLPAGGDQALGSFKGAVKENLPEGGFTVRDRRDPSPQVTRTLERLRQFLTLVGLTALLVGGVGVANAVATYIDRRRKVIAEFRSLGATSDVVFGVHLAQVGFITVIGIAIGMVLGFLIPMGLTQLVGDTLPIKGDITVSGRAVITAAGYGLLVSLLFTLWPLGRAEQVRAGVLFRDEVAPESVWPKPYIMVLTATVLGLLVAFATLSAEVPRLALAYCGGVAAVFVVFAALGQVVAWGARKVPRPRQPELALAIGNLGAPGGLTRSVVLSLGVGLSLLVSVAQVDRSIVSELTQRLPKESPSYFVLDIKRSEADAFRALVLKADHSARVHEAPMLRGRLVKLGDRPVETIKAPPEAQWVLTGDRGLSYSEEVPEGSTVVAGSWWAPGYKGEPLVSFEAELAKGLGVKIGDTVTVNVLGRNLTARVANLREVHWESLSLNFVLVFSPNTLAGAPHNLLATVTLPNDATLATEARLAQEIGRAFPATTAIRVKDAIEAFNKIFARVMTAVRAAGGVTLVAGAFVLAGALATAQRRRTKQAVILKALGATRRRILVSHFLEYAILAVITSVIALAIGTLAAYITLSRVMDVGFAFSGVAALQTILLATVLVVVFGGYGTWRVLKAPPVPHLRAE